MDPASLPEWRVLARLAGSPPSIAASFSADLNRADSHSIEVPVLDTALLFDYSRQQVDETVLAALFDLARARRWGERRDAMFAGEVVNVSEDRAALHVALRAATGGPARAESSASATASSEWARVCRFAESVRDGGFRGARGEPISHVIAVGIGGSDLGPRLVHRAVSAMRTPDLDCRFVSSLDPVDRERALVGCDPASTLLVVGSKSFSTRETLRNAAMIQAWMADAIGGQAAVAQSVGVSVVEPSPSTLEVGMWFRLWPWVGGRFSLASAINLVNVIAFGSATCERMLAGMRAMDEHFLDAPEARNAPLVHGLLSVWNRSFLGRPTRAVVAYGEALGGLPAYLQQLEMESLGKSVREDGSAVSYETGPVVWGGSGPESQHAFMQALHQGTSVVPVDFVGVATTTSPDTDGHRELLANLVAQADTLALGRAAGAHDSLPGNRPSSILLTSSMDPACLGALIALYEHSVLVQATIWGVDPFDQWGVEEAKRRAVAMVAGASDSSLPSRALNWPGGPAART